MTPHAIGVWFHLACGFAAVGLGLVVMLLPKFGRNARWHRALGRLYASLIAIACLLGVPLAYFRDSTYLMTLGVMTFLVVVQGWRDAGFARQAQARGDFAEAGRRLRWHLILMGASYIGAWSGFFATNPILGVGEWQVWVYVFGPSLIGAVFITRAVRRMAAGSTSFASQPDPPR
jgi:uncharacterized membrane protein